jgi:hypothetical protein
MRTTLRLSLVGTAILALAAGTAGIAVAQDEADDDAVPAAVTESPSPIFPTGAFVSLENKHLMLEFGGDGTAVKHDLADRTTSFTYAVDDDVYTWLTSANRNQRYGQPTYAWDYDGTRLAFELLGEDAFDYRRWVYAENTFERVEDPQVVVVAERDLDVGESVRPIRGYVPAAEVGPDAYISMMDVVGYVAAVPISKGQPITSDVVQPRPAE